MRTTRHSTAQHSTSRHAHAHICTNAQTHTGSVVGAGCRGEGEVAGTAGGRELSDA